MQGDNSVTKDHALLLSETFDGPAGVPYQVTLTRSDELYATRVPSIDAPHIHYVSFELSVLEFSRLRSMS